MIWGGVNLGVRPLWDPAQARGVKVPQTDPHADAVSETGLSDVPRRMLKFPQPAGAAYDWRAENRGSGRPPQLGGR